MYIYKCVLDNMHGSDSPNHSMTLSNYATRSILCNVCVVYTARMRRRQQHLLTSDDSVTLLARIAMDPCRPARMDQRI
jgi:hypothetical protein